ncbi:CocE/NonD family hydrolase [Nonomuraea endophytica]|uniref:Putative CocE/NonD family hydrolase n=1 Tax=Nonomuraea endophytica TaxID=714136 RepID=A0A7W8ACA0_9ACTN|nr:CocE/NonD family hydrolase [Nonomuraea endophytica]MBB5083609.1 putative CocE/NonD family hydrolase [Nonomuraea endophytica]
MREADDAADIVAWMREQPWFDGRFATHDFSSVGFAAGALLKDPPAELAAAVIACAPHNFGAFVYTGGAFLLSTVFEWSFATSKQEKPILPRILGILSSRGRVKKALAALPLAGAAERLMGGKAPWYREWVSRRDLDHPWWKRADLTEALDRVRVPVLVQGGWQDGFLRQTLTGYARLAGRGVDAGLTVGPWTHAQAGAGGARILLPEALAWFDEHLAGSSARRRVTPVKVFRSGPARGSATFRPGRRRRPSRSFIPAPAISWPLNRPTREKRASSPTTPSSRLPRTAARSSPKFPRSDRRLCR